jgi:hypothetical protein
MMHVMMMDCQKAVTGNHCKLLMVLLHDGIFNKHMELVNIILAVCLVQKPDDELINPKHVAYTCERTDMLYLTEK